MLELPSFMETTMFTDISQAREALCRTGATLSDRHWTPATSGNFSLRYQNSFLVTRSGADKGRLSADDILRLDSHGRVQESDHKASAETALHLQIYAIYPWVNCVLHVHSVSATAISLIRERVCLSGYELLKALPGIDTHLADCQIPVLQNSQDMEATARNVPY